MSAGTAARISILLAAMGAGCDATGVGPANNPVPIVDATDPAVVLRSSTSQEIDVLGLGFVEGSTARFNGDERPTTYVSPTRLTLTLAAADPESGSGEIDVVNPPPGGGSSGPVILTVGHPVPRITGMTPTTAPAVVTSELTLQLSGTDFITGPGGSQVLWDGIPLTTTVASSGALAATVPDYLLQGGDSVAVTVFNPAPGGGSSIPAYFGVVSPVPTLTGTDPVGVVASTETVLEVMGSNFTYATVVWVGDTPLTPEAVSASRLRVRVPGALAVGGTTLSVRVENPAPGGGSSETFDVAVWTSPPRIDYISPTRVFVGAPGFTLTIVGADFDPAATLTVNGESRGITFVSASRLETQIPPTDVAAEGELDIRITNPGEGSVALAVLTVVEGSESNRVVAEVWGGTEILFTNLDGSESSTVTPGHGAARVDAAPVGDRAVYHGSGRIHEVDALTGASRRLTLLTSAADLAEESWPRYSSDGGWVYFNGTPQGGQGAIWRVRTDEPIAEPVIADADSWVGYPAPSNDGHRIVYATGSTRGGPLEVYDLESESSTPLGVEGVTARWSPGDEWILYLTPRFELRAIRPNGAEDFAVVTDIDVGYGFDFSADGSAIVATTQDGGGVLIAFPSGTVESLPEIGDVASIAFFGP